MDVYMQKEHRYREFLLQEGDALYIPRGWIHNASTVGPDLVLTSLKEEEEQQQEKEESIEYWSEPSLHITFGIEHMCFTTYEGLILYAVRLFHAQKYGRTGGVAISKQACPGAALDISWQMILQFAISDAVRRGCTVTEEEEEKETSTTLVYNRHDIGCQLRKSVPRGDAWNEIYSIIQNQQPQPNSMYDTYVNILDNLNPTLEHAAQFVHRVQTLGNEVKEWEKYLVGYRRQGWQRDDAHLRGVHHEPPTLLNEFYDLS
eukprot:5597054-Ditylum_brightwellii.AAC.1